MSAPIPKRPELFVLLPQAGCFRLWSVIRSLAFFVVLLLTAVVGQAGDLAWKQTMVEKTASPSDKAAEAVFEFTNTGKVPVEIRNVKTSCGCTTAGAEKKVYQPGETGQVRAIFTFGGRKGLQEKKLIVQTSEKTGAPDVLVMRVLIPDSVKVDKDALTWKVGGSPEAQTFEISVVEPETTKVKSVRALGGGFEASLREVEPGRKYAVDVTPVGTEKPKRGTIRLEIADPGNRAIFLRTEVRS